MGRHIPATFSVCPTPSSQALPLHVVDTHTQRISGEVCLYMASRRRVMFSNRQRLVRKGPEARALVLAFGIRREGACFLGRVRLHTPSYQAGQDDRVRTGGFVSSVKECTAF